MADEKDGRPLDPWRHRGATAVVLDCLFLEFLGVKNKSFDSRHLVWFFLTHGVKYRFSWTSSRLVLGSNSDSDTTFVTLVKLSKFSEI